MGGISQVDFGRQGFGMDGENTRNSVDRRFQLDWKAGVGEGKSWRKAGRSQAVGE